MGYNLIGTKLKRLERSIAVMQANIATLRAELFEQQQEYQELRAEKFRANAR